MTDNPTPVVAHLGEGLLDVGGGNLIPISSAPMPVTYFDSAPSLSHMNGIIGITLVVTGNIPVGTEKTTMCASVVAHLKCNIQAAMMLRGALDSALLLAQPVEQPEGKSN